MSQLQKQIDSARNSARKTSETTTRISIKEIDVERFNSRDVDLTHVKAIEEAMTEEVFFPRILVAHTDNRYVLIDGRHRLEALKRLGQSSVDVELLSHTSVEELIVAAIEGNRHGKPLSTGEKRTAFLKFYPQLTGDAKAVKSLARTFAVSKNTIKSWMQVPEQGGQIDPLPSRPATQKKRDTPETIAIPYTCILKPGESVTVPKELDLYNEDFFVLFIPKSRRGNSLQVTCEDQTFAWSEDELL